MAEGWGRDLLDAGYGDDLVFGGAGDDNPYGNAGNDTLYGGDGNDVVSGGDGNDVLFNGAGNDTGTWVPNPTYTGGSYGDAGDDTIWAAGDDRPGRKKRRHRRTMRLAFVTGNGHDQQDTQ